MKVVVQYVCRPALQNWKTTQPFNPVFLARSPAIRGGRFASSISETAAPRIAQPSLWKSLIPKPLRRRSQTSSSHEPKNRKEWNPFIVYMVMFTLIGSNAINMIGLRNEILSFSQKTDRQISLLAEVIRKVQNGEHVNVEAILGTGDPESEQDWDEALQEIGSKDSRYDNEKRRLDGKSQNSTGADRPGNSKQGVAHAKSPESVDEQMPKKRSGFY